MKKYSIALSIFVLVFASLACQTLMGGGNRGAPDLLPNDGGIPTIPSIATDEGGSGSQLPTDPPAATDDGGFTFGGKTDFPLPADAANVISMGNDLVTYQTKLSLDEGIKFYRDEFGKLGYTEREDLTVTTGSVFSMVFDGHESGKSVIVQGLDLGDGSISITITLSDT